MSTEQDTRRVSQAYRDIAHETSPTELDDKVLAMARQEARTRYGLARAWIRPAAWAATIALSFAFILEMTYFSKEPSVAVPAPASSDSDAARQAAPSPAPKEAAFKRSPSTMVTAPEIKASEMPALRETEERTDGAAYGVAEDLAPAEPRRERAIASFADSMPHCNAEDRKSAETWYRCVLALREQGLEDAAAVELDALREAFPDFREPVPE
jgi:hypothetical protein